MLGLGSERTGRLVAMRAVMVRISEDDETIIDTMHRATGNHAV